MLTPRRSALVLLVALAACRAASDSPTAPNVTAPIGGAAFAKPVDPGYKVYQDGNTIDAQTQPSGGAYLAGGGTDVDAGMVWLMGQGGTRCWPVRRCRGAPHQRQQRLQQVPR